jgi:hypothetical protein
MNDRRAEGITRTLLVVDGYQAGRRFRVPSGRWTIGRDDGCDVIVDDPGVSRRHARVTNADGTLWVEDVGSTNGTWVDGERLAGRRELATGADVRVGGALLRLEGPSGVDAGESTPRPRRRVSLARVALVGALANLVILAAGVVIQFLTDWTGIGPWLAAPLVGMVASLVEVGKESLTRVPSESAATPTAPRPAEPHVDERAPGAGAPRPGPAGRRAPIGAGILVAVLIIGGGGLALAYGIGTLTSFVTGNQSGTERLVTPVAQEAQGVTVTVQSVEQTRDFTRVEVSVRNGLSNTITLPLFENATMRAPDGTTLKADSFRSSWSDSIAPGQLSSGTVVFPGHLPDATPSATFAFARVFEQGFEGPDSIVVDGLMLRGLE